VLTAGGFTLGLAVGEGVFEATGSVSSGDADGFDTSIVGFTVGEDADVEIGDDEGFSIDRDSLWFGVQRESINTDKTANAKMTTRVFF
jgi:FKBP-type peptidyl-prolyl cis-trans isomerase 2